jgi:hypothetical protein
MTTAQNTNTITALRGNTKERNKMKARKITDPYYGRGFSLSIGQYSLEVTVGTCDRLFGFKVIATPPFDTHKVNSGDESVMGYLELGVQASLAWVTANVSLHRWQD